ncbi:MAG: hypothetical protein EPO07_11585 [Verrucomicrobia bacterium]|nr:MAG: hypothetical protein EPO07_11585 [Verrucomicrobiota bacterium]
MFLAAPVFKRFATGGAIEMWRAHGVGTEIELEARAAPAWPGFAEQEQAHVRRRERFAARRVVNVQREPVFENHQPIIAAQARQMLAPKRQFLRTSVNEKQTVMLEHPRTVSNQTRGCFGQHGSARRKYPLRFVAVEPGVKNNHRMTRVWN